MDIDDDLPPPAPPVPATAPSTRPSVLRSLAIGGAIGLVPVAALFAWILSGSQRSGPHPSSEAAKVVPVPSSTVAPPPASVERQTAARRLAGWRDEPLALSDPTTAMPMPMTVAMTARPPFQTIDAVLFDTTDARIRLHGVLPVGREEVCLDGENNRFACGLQARASLQNFIRDKTVVCRPVFGNGERRDEVTEADCAAGGRSLALHQVAAGFAFPTGSETGPLQDAMAQARAKRLGVWSGDYPIPTTDHSEADARSIRFGAARATPAPAETPPAPTRAVEAGKSGKK